jgi:hypothetical protein
MRIQFIAVSQNAKTGPIPASIVERASCWPGCALYENGCYAETGALAMHWGRVSCGLAGGSWSEFRAKVAALRPGRLWRYAQAGDLPGYGAEIDGRLLNSETGANGDSPANSLASLAERRKRPQLHGDERQYLGRRPWLDDSSPRNIGRTILPHSQRRRFVPMKHRAINLSVSDQDQIIPSGQYRARSGHRLRPPDRQPRPISQPRHFAVKIAIRVGLSTDRSESRTH